MSLSRKRTLLIAAFTSLSLALCLQPLSSGAEAIPGSNSGPKGSATKASAKASSKQTRATQSKTADALRMQQAVKQVANQRAAEQRAGRIRDLLAQGELDYSQGRLFEPTDNNAAAKYKEVLMLDPTQPQALAATQRIADILAAEAEAMAVAGDQARTQQYILQLRALQPNNTALAGLEARSQSLLTNPVVLSADQQERYNRAARNIAEAYEKLKNQPLGLETLDQVVRRYDRAAGSIAQAPGLPKLKDRIALALPAAVRAELTAGDPRSAYLVVQIARKHGWFTDELEALEVKVRAAIQALPLPPKSLKP